MTRLLTEAEAWREIARALEQEPEVCGICYEIDNLTGDVWGTVERVHPDVETAMRRRLRDTFEEDGDHAGYKGLFFWEAGLRGPRIIAALLLAELAEEVSA